MASRNNSKSSGLRILWIPGGRKSHPKGRFDATNKHISPPSHQKKNEVWSLGGKKSHKDMIETDPDTALLDGPSSSSITPAACALGAAAAGVAKCTPAITVESAAHNPPQSPTAAHTTAEVATHKPPEAEQPASTLTLTPTTPNSTTSTALLVSLPSSPVSNTAVTTTTTETIVVEKTTTTTPATEADTTSNMPTKTASPVSVITTTTTTAEIMDENRFSILGKDISNEFDVYNLPSPPKDDLNLRDNLLLNTSAGTTNSTATTSTPSPSISSKSDAKGVATSTPSKHRLSQHKNNNNNHQDDINSIESISEHTKIPTSDMEWMDELLLERNSKELLKNKRKKKKKISTTKEMDQLDGVPSKLNTSETTTEDDEKMVKCLYYTLMCCECTIS